MLVNKRWSAGIRRFMKNHSRYDMLSLPEAVRAAVRDLDSYMLSLSKTVEQVRDEMKQKEVVLQSAIDMAFTYFGNNTQKPKEVLEKDGYSVIELDAELTRDFLTAVEVVKVMKQEGLLERRKADASSSGG